VVLPSKENENDAFIFTFIVDMLLGCSITSIGGVYAALPILNQQFP
jgi:hypothetical protein